MSSEIPSGEQLLHVLHSSYNTAFAVVAFPTLKYGICFHVIGQWWLAWRESVRCFSDDGLVDVCCCRTWLPRRVSSTSSAIVVRRTWHPSPTCRSSAATRRSTTPRDLRSVVWQNVWTPVSWNSLKLPSQSTSCRASWLLRRRSSTWLPWRPTRFTNSFYIDSFYI